MAVRKKRIGYIILFIGLFFLGCIYPVLFPIYVIWTGLYLIDKHS